MDAEKIDTGTASLPAPSLEAHQEGCGVTYLDESGVPVMSADNFSDKGPINFTLLLACFTVWGTGFISGYDQLVTSPVVGLPAFVGSE
jgi:hypothetical protein